MQEDHAGTRTAGTANRYGTCAECGQVFLRHQARTTDAGLNDDARSEFTELCPECDRLDRQGEQPVLSSE